MTHRVLSVGQCGFDGPGIARRLKENFDVSVAGADSAAEALDDVENGRFSLILINRILDATGEDGVALLRELKTSSAGDTPMMLVSNFEDAQSRAVAAGAEPGFGKNDLGPNGMLARVKPFLDG